MNTISIHKWEMGILTNAKTAPSLILKNAERLKNKIQYGFCLKENGIGKRQVDFDQKAEHLNQNKKQKIIGLKEIQKNIKLIPQFIMHYVMEKFTDIHVVFVDQKHKRTMKIIASLLK